MLGNKIIELGFIKSTILVTLLVTILSVCLTLSIYAVLGKPTNPASLMAATFTPMTLVPLTAGYAIKLYIKAAFLEHNLQQLNNELEQKVEEGIQKYKEQEELLFFREKKAAMGEIIDAIVHQWKQPLTTIKIISSGMIVSNQINNVNSNTENQLEEIITQVNYLVETIDELNNFYKLEKEKSDISINQLIQSTISLNDSIVEKYNIKFHFKNNQDLSYSLYENEFKQVLVNLIINSKDAFIKNNIEQKNITIDFYEENDRFLLSFSDCAGGIDETNIDKIFKSGFSTKEKTEGSGVGLSIAKRIVEKLDGNISVKNIKCGNTKGTNFLISLPL